ncbi:MAG TPA: hypothetical protein VGI95_22245 [Caulobacteraceae bacterium]|jgi:hypothetical protein
MRSLLVAISLAMAAFPALADTTAVYEGFGDFKLNIEIAANGDFRMPAGLKPDQYFLVHNGEGFIVLSTAHGAVVDRLSDYERAKAAVIDKQAPGLRAMVQSEEPPAATPADALVEIGAVTVNGRAGTGYYVDQQSAADHGAPDYVISHDPALAPLSAAMRRQSDMIRQLGGGMSITSASDKALDKLLETGGPLAFGPFKLTSLSIQPIAASRFALPAPPETPAAIRARIKTPDTN